MEYKIHRLYDNSDKYSHVVFIETEIKEEKYVSSLGFIYPKELKKFVNQALKDIKKGANKPIYKHKKN
jgi:hypothetical protein